VLEEEFLEGLPDDPGEAGRLICEQIISAYNSLQDRDITVRYYDFVKAYEVLRTFADVSSAPIGAARIGGINLRTDIESIVSFCRTSIAKLAQFSVTSNGDAIRELLTKKFGTVFLYEFTDGDLDRIQELLNELRDLIRNADGLEEEHRQRLLKRLERMQGELHKKVSDLDRFWGLVGDAGVVLGKLGEAAKPIVDRIREIAEIVWRTQARKEELSSDSKPALLEPDEH
jgi:hypothetical protein